MLYPLVLFQAMRSARVDFIVLDITVAVLLTVPVFALLRRHPWPAFGMLLFAWLAAVVLADGRYGMIGGLQVVVLDIAVGLITMERSRRASFAAAAAAVPTQLACTLRYVHGNAVLPAAGSIVLAGVVAWMAGNSVRERRQHAEAITTQATEQAVTAKRLRIARELHDMVAHSIGIIAIQAGAGSRVIETQPHEARKALSAIETTSRETLAGLRRMLVALRAADPDAAARPAPLDPAPGLADVQRLVATALDAGVHVDVRRLGQPRALPAELDLSAFRIVQEALTNVVRHAGASRCRVTLDYRGEELAVEITDDGRGCDQPAAAGFGITGMRERASLLHGQFSAGPRPEGGFRVRARLPLPVEAEEVAAR